MYRAPSCTQRGRSSHKTGSFCGRHEVEILYDLVCQRSPWIRCMSAGKRRLI